MRIMGKHIRIILTGAVLFVSVLAFLWYRSESEFVPYESFNDFLKERPRTEAEIMRYTEDLRRAYEDDTYGGKTPQETFQLFTEALKDGNTELASKYFLIERQKSMREQFDLGKKSGGLVLLLEYLEKVNDENKSESGDGYSFNVIEGGLLRMSFSLIKNPYSGIWKLEDL